MIDGGPVEAHKFTKLLRELDSHDYIWLETRDDNREYYGLQLRDIFTQCGGTHHPSIANKRCSFLEFLIGMANRVEETLMDNPRYGNRRPDWFWMMVSNLELTRFDDSKEFNLDVLNYIHGTIDRVLFRRFDANGDGGLFPLKSPKSDQRNTDFWTQLMLYLEENYHEV
jgi:hypothetical protein